ncbi:hypothetical protein Tco_0435322 [Tanacetum coccineum]
MELEHDLNSKADCEIQWEDLIFKEEMRHGKVDFWTVWLGSFARVYYGLWNGSVNPYYPEADIAVKVYFSNQYSEKVLQDYRKMATSNPWLTMEEFEASHLQRIRNRRPNSGLKRVGLTGFRRIRIREESDEWLNEMRAIEVELKDLKAKLALLCVAKVTNGAPNKLSKIWWEYFCRYSRNSVVHWRPVDYIGEQETADPTIEVHTIFSFSADNGPLMKNRKWNILVIIVCSITQPS